MMRHYVSTSQKGINRDSLPFKLYEKAKKFGTWDPNNIDFSKDKADWESLNADQQDTLLQIISFFYSAEAAVTHAIFFHLFMQFQKQDNMRRKCI